MTTARTARMVAIGALAGLVIALGFAFAMPTKYVTTTPLSARSRVQLYGALAQQNQRPRTGPTATTVREKSPRTERDALLGLIAGGLLAFALVTTGRRELGGSG
jgi:high-affinity Fe2+/Pb2+ permease